MNIGRVRELQVQCEQMSHGPWLQVLLKVQAHLREQQGCW
jgi:hypothetical protein